jgi:hypothetical protein
MQNIRTLFRGQIIDAHIERYVFCIFDWWSCCQFVDALKVTVAPRIVILEKISELL